MSAIDGTKSCAGCGALIVWRYTVIGKIMPLDATMLLGYEPGCYVIEGKHCRKAAPLFDTGPFARPHWGSCPVGDNFRVRDMD